LSRKAISNPEGVFFVPALPPGIYVLTAHVSGFKAFTRTGIEVSVGQNTRADVQLDVGAVAENVTVQGTVLGVDTHGDTAKNFACELVVSDETVSRAGLDLSGSPLHEIEIRGKREMLAVRIVERAAELPAAGAVPFRRIELIDA